MRLPFRRSHQRGDTIVEVLIAITIVSLVLVAAHNVSRHSSQGERTSQESAELHLLLQGQVELVRQLARETGGLHSTVFAASPKYFCIDVQPDSDTYGQLVPFDLSITALPGGNRFNPLVYPAKCRDIDTHYALAVTYNQTTNVFEFTGQWERPSGTLGQEKIFYRLFPGNALAGPDIPPPDPTPGPGGTPPDPGDPGDPDDDGTADIGTKVCEKDPATGKCVKGGPKTGPIVYHWGTSFENLSDNPGMTVVGCEWDFGDDTPPVKNKDCNKGDYADHIYTPPSDAPPAPELCKDKYPDTLVTLTMYFAGGKSAKTTATKHIPVCYADY